MVSYSKRVPKGQDGLETLQEASASSSSTNLGNMKDIKDIPLDTFHGSRDIEANFLGNSGTTVLPSGNIQTGLKNI